MDERIGIIGGTGVYTLEGVEHEGAVEMDTPWGRPSGPIVLARLQGVPLAFLARHGEGHVFTPSEVPYAANIYAMKKTGVRKLISVSAVGSLKEKIPPRDFVVPVVVVMMGGDAHSAVPAPSFPAPMCPITLRCIVSSMVLSSLRPTLGRTNPVRIRQAPKRCLFSNHAVVRVTSGGGNANFSSPCGRLQHLQRPPPFAGAAASHPSAR